MRVYLDTSALVKLLVREPESEVLRATLAGFDSWMVSIVGSVELQRVARRSASPEAVHAKARDLLRRMNVIEVNDEIVNAASLVSPASLGTLDALHVGTAVALGRDLDVFVTYDQRQGESAGNAGLDVLSPS